MKSARAKALYLLQEAHDDGHSDPELAAITQAILYVGDQLARANDLRNVADDR